MWLFREHPLLKAMMTIISGCTYIMIVSSAYRMILYVQNYHLTFLRILVLWTLAVLAVLLAGVIISVYRRSFPLFRYCVVVVTVCYIALAYAKPDARIAEYNLNQAKIRSEGEAVVEDPWFYRNLSVDAVPCILAEDNFSILSEAGPEEECSWKWESYLEKISAMENGGRHFNLSVYRAQKAVERFRNQE